MRSAAVAALLLCGAGCARAPSPAPSKPRPVLVVAVDALDLATVRQLAASGRLPVLARLLREGSLARLDLERPSEPAVAWGEAATGFAWRRNGLFVDPVPKRDGGELSGEEALVAPPIWDATPALHAGWLATGPPFPPGGSGTTGLLRSAAAADEATVERALRSREQLRMLRLREPATAAIFFWQRHAPGAEGYVRPAAGGPDPIPLVYGRLDARLGRLLESALPGTAFLLVSSSGVAPLVPPRALVLDVERLLSRLGYLSFVEPPGDVDRASRSVDAGRSALLPIRSPRWPSFGRPIFLYLGRKAAPEGGQERFARGLSWVLGQVHTRASGTPLFRRVEVWDGPTAATAVRPALVLWPDPAALLDDVVVRGQREAQVLKELVYRYDLPTGSAEGPGWVLAAGDAFRRPAPPGSAREGALAGAPAMRPADLAALILFLRGVPAPPEGDGRLPSDLLDLP